MSAHQLSLFHTPASPPVISPGLPDREARDRILHDLDTNLLVEAGAGAGKTTEMVRRMVALVQQGRAEVHQIAAVTFTRKAAAELRQRFQTALERELRVALERADDIRATRLDRGLREVDRAFLGTIHAFCARLLRERPLEAGLDPGFRELLGAEERRQRRQFWFTHLERLAADGDATLAELREIGLRPPQLLSLFDEMVEQPDVVYPAARVERPDAGLLRRRLEAVLDRAVGPLPREEPGGGWDRLQTTLRMLRFHRLVLGWTSDTHFLDVIGELTASSFTATKKKWANGAAAREIGTELVSLFAEDGAAGELLRAWRAYRYPIALEFVRAAAVSYEHERLRAGTLNFQDLLLHAARLLRESPSARRELSQRYRFLLVDEFQDTDPIQAEVLFLLASDEELPAIASRAALFARAPAGPLADALTFAAWRALTPRPGALFVVGDPKQSIYRFRRADMLLYAQIRARFQEWSRAAPATGAVVELVANFRSRPPIEMFVNEIFRERFPAEASETQAPFAPMRTQPRADARVAAEGVFWYELDDPVHGRVEQLAVQDSARVASWIAERVATGARRPGDFLVLTPNTKRLAQYASALEACEVAVQVTGAGVGADVELRELRLLLGALADPGDATLTVAVLVGLFFGLDYEQLTAHALGETATSSEAADPTSPRQSGAPFSFTRLHGAVLEDDAAADHEANADSADPVRQALARLRHFWLLTRREPADIAVPRIVEELGVLPLAAAGGLGESRAGALLFALDAIRAAGLAGDASLAGALATLDAALDEDESEAPLEPGRADVVRVMNVHKAKGLEAPVVVLAMPFGEWSPAPTQRVVRDETGSARAYATVVERRGTFGRPVVLAQPADWERHAAIEVRFQQAEDERLLYVAATRAAQELIVGCAYNGNSRSPWRSFYAWLHERAERIQLPEPRQPRRPPLRQDPAVVLARIESVAAARARLSVPGYRAAAVTARKAEIAAPQSGAVAPADLTDLLIDRRLRGTEWGTIVHDALLAAAQGAEGGALRQLGRNLLVGAGRPAGADGEPLELEELLATIAGVQRSAIWQRALASAQRLIEVPFAIGLTDTEYRALVDAPASAPAAPLELIDGRIDLVFRERAGWVIVDYKSDAAGARIPADLLERYRSQVHLYARVWSRLTGEPVTESMLLFTATATAMVVRARAEG